MQRAAMTAFTDASGALSTNPGWLETWLTSLEQHIRSPHCSLDLIIIDDTRAFWAQWGSLKHKLADNESEHFVLDYFI